MNNEELENEEPDTKERQRSNEANQSFEDRIANLSFPFILVDRYYNVWGEARMEQIWRE